MSTPDERWQHDRALRDAALRLVKADIALVRDDLAARGVGTRVADRVGDAALETLDDAVGYAQDHRGQVAAAITALVLFLFRGPLLDALAALIGDDEAEDEDQDEDMVEAEAA